MFQRIPPPDARALATLLGGAAVGTLGLLPGAAGAFDPVTLLGWLTLIAPAIGALCGAQGLTLFPFALALPGTWMLLWGSTQIESSRAAATPLWAAFALVGLFAVGFAIGRRSRVPLRSAGLLVLLTMGLTGASLGGFGLLAGGNELARVHPLLAERLLDLSPLVLVFDCAGWDWLHAQPEVYARSGVEWFQRRPYSGGLAGTVVLVVGCGLAVLVRRPAARPVDR